MQRALGRFQLDELPVTLARRGDFPPSEDPARRSLVLPFHNRLTDVEPEEV
jgi:hypothetical protein